MTKYILHGGRISLPKENNDRFYHEIISGFQSPINILLVYFARDEDEWNRMYKDDSERFKEFGMGKQIICSIADSDTHILTQQIIDSEVILIRGGDTAPLFEILSKVESIRRLFEGKTIAGSSAGAYFLTKYFYDNDRKVITKGHGVIPIKAICHYEEGMEDIEKELISYKENLPLYKIPEAEFVVLEK